jgi:hypothetical protein
MELTHVTFQGPPIDDPEILKELPRELRHILLQINGFIQFGGGLHVRGACQQPAWHSLRATWHGPEALHRAYPAVRETDVPFAQDCLGDQFVLRDGAVWKLAGETGELAARAGSLADFFAKIEDAPVQFLSLQPLIRFYRDGGNLQPGRLLNAAPPYCVCGDGDVSLKAIPADDRLRFLADFSRQITDVPDGTKIEIVIKARE